MGNKLDFLKITTGFIVLVSLIFLTVVYLFPEDLQIIFKKMSRLGPSYPGEGDLRTFIYTISSSDLQPGEVVGYRTYAQDDSGNWNVTDIRTFTVSTTAPTYDVNTDMIRIMNNTDNSVSSINRGDPYKIRVDISNNNTSSRQMVIISQVINPNNQIRERIRSTNKEINAQNQSYVELNYTAPDITGTYTIQIFVWSNWASLGGVPLANPSTTIFEVI
jgi:hypothetical protein